MVEPKFCPPYQGVPNSGASGIFLVGVVCVAVEHSMAVEHNMAVELSMAAFLRAFLCCTLAGNARQGLVL